MLYKLCVRGDRSERLGLLDYRGLGGIRRVIETHAEATHASLDRQEKIALQELLRGLGDHHPERPPTRRQASKTELTSRVQDPEVAAAVIHKLVSARLLVSSSIPESNEPHYEFSHDAVLAHWSVARKALEQGYETIQEERLLEASAAAWERSGKPASLLWDAPKLRRAKKTIGPSYFRRSPFLSASRRRNRLRKLRAAAIAGLAVAGLLVVGVKFFRWVMIQTRFAEWEAPASLHDLRDRFVEIELESKTTNLDWIGADTERVTLVGATIEFPWVSSEKNWRTLSFRNCRLLKDVGMSAFSSLQELEVLQSPALTGVSGEDLECYPNLERLTLRPRSGHLDVSLPREHALKHLELEADNIALSAVDLGGIRRAEIYCEGLFYEQTQSALVAPHLTELVLELGRPEDNLIRQWDTPRLETLIVRDSSRADDLETLPISDSLHDLFLSNCSKLKSLDELQALTSLRRLEIEGCRSIEDWSVLESLQGLEHVRVSGYTAAPFPISELPASMVSLDLETNWQEPALPPVLPNLSDVALRVSEGRDLAWLSALESLNQLSLSGSEIGHLPKLPLAVDVALFVRGNREVSLPPGIRLRSLKVVTGTGMRDLTLLSGQRELERLELRDCPDLVSLTGVEDCSELRFLSIRDCPKLQSLDALAALPQLNKVELTGVPGVASVAALSRAPNLRELEIRGDEHIPVALGALSAFPSLTRLDVQRRPVDLAELRASDTLKHLTLTQFGPAGARHSDLTGLDSLPSLEFLDLHLIGLSSFKGLGRLPNLRELKVGSFNGIDAEPLRELRNLRLIELTSIWYQEASIILASLPESVTSIRIRERH